MSLRPLYITWAAIALLTNGMLVLLEWLVLLPIDVSCGVVLLLTLLAAVILVVAFVSLIGLVFKSARKTVNTILLMAGIWLAAYVFLFFVGVASAKPIRAMAFETVAKRSAPIVQAVERFEKGHMRLPAELGELVPEYLPRIPTEQIGQGRQFDYSILTDPVHGPSSWKLSVKFHCGGCLFFCDDVLYYRSDRVCVEQHARRVGDWCYVRHKS
ncbi:MAG: hypothetical protein HY897_18535 [Deltaproteobacteria bacterium]|nr:hypothetical protein [Deltaproteobacteria bacterium]